MKRLIMILAMLASPAMAQDFSEGSEAKTWNLYGESPARFEAKVVDILCEMTGDCAADCGGGTRQLGLLRKADAVLVFPNKNAQAAFTGAALELAPFCGKEVEVDGLLITDADLGAMNVYLVQKIRTLGDAEWTAANRWTKEWAKANPEAKGKGPWFRRDPRIKAQIAAHGYTGTGAEAEKPFIQDWFE
ncbi:hypothetical protein SAMN05444414_10976 [Roseovarius marisflavi]|uniref:Uncharacterized protein n=1 Tax=Roseovarius marisflavi TaxID=1054996 RepID=A0A1M6ZA04_9RHOB|nr:hypothetical protein [Roseovarius marisflavi]SHL27257.1 hypothetical protein SAMN05444414_10976 [Roseovarius marisflavi]